MASDVTGSVIEQTADEREEIYTLIGGPPPFDSDPPDSPGDDEPFGDDGEPRGVPINNARLGMIMLLGAETMFFAGLVGSFLVFRVANTMWPPPMFPQLPVLVTGVNTLFLLYSAVTMCLAQRAIQLGEVTRCGRMLLVTLGLGLLFLGIQGYEWLKLIDFGLTLSSGVYGATFYILIGCHAIHVMGAVVWLAVVWGRVTAGCYSQSRYIGVSVCGMYWLYVVALWPILYWLVYLY